MEESQKTSTFQAPTWNLRSTAVLVFRTLTFKLPGSATRTFKYPKLDRIGADLNIRKYS